MNKLTLDEYQAAAEKTAFYEDAIIYPSLGMAGEAGEVCNKIKKWIRDGDLDHHEVAKELGDVLWYVAMLASDLEYDLSEIAQMNIWKLNGREKRGTLKGSGDDR